MHETPRMYLGPTVEKSMALKPSLNAGGLGCSAYVTWSTNNGSASTDCAMRQGASQFEISHGLPQTTVCAVLFLLFASVYSRQVEQPAFHVTGIYVFL